MLVVLLLAGCAVGPSRRPPVATINSDEPPAPTSSAPTAPPPPPSLLPPLVATSPQLDFTECTAGQLTRLGGAAALGGRDLRLGCATVPVGGGYGTGSTTGAAEVEVTRVTLGPAPALPSVPIAVLGDPGRRSGTEQAVRLAARAPADLLAGRTLYGVDVRGAASGGVDCITPSTRAAIDDADPTAADPTALAPLAAAAATAARTCSQLLEDSLTEYGTATDADDLDEVRRALGTPRLHAIGLGGGAATLARWAQDHPDQQGRLVLDALPDPTAPVGVTADQRAVAARAALDAFATNCVATACPLGADPRGAVTDLLARLRAAPLPSPPTSTGTLPDRELTAGTVVSVLAAELAEPDTWPTLAAALSRARAGDPAGVIALADTAENDGGFDLALVTTCNDEGERPTVDQVAQASARARGADPVFGGWFAQRALVCSSWPVPTTPPAPLAGTAVPILLVGTTADPLVPLAETQRVAAGMQGTALVSWLGAGHGAYPSTPCITGVVEDYLLREDVPREGTVCPP
ncbi:alpha/beta hydrolase [Actinomycetospora termitidis]|uniref:Alpha/beta hydrolase n=1 Tax=Actinomycetospora termitidis TaxID=3053470 RepID=A0ABT7M7F7_9PSEU|nr:alpha/beta hydrolase [Actinomycetospora sp. Odt1-22]MDL5156606.1 alpha/beta hydrolase [Actinomycetospora sp. Odt1-22]